MCKNNFTNENEFDYWWCEDYHPYSIPDHEWHNAWNVFKDDIISIFK